MSNAKKIKQEVDDIDLIERERELVMGALEELFAENEKNVRNKICSQLAVQLKGNDSEHDKAIQLAIRIARGVEDEQV